MKYSLYDYVYRETVSVSVDSPFQGQTQNIRRHK